ncbi:WxL domain-containing protein [Lacticaseibacillus absianus]|uniref:WxL domain-containing protein n=1 Tax=Lacticaseibacillus absianus TaxID=2729623 RepID=UPI0015CCC81A|nr:WxL domain-containing protein [Lacticaseibacillus absianus]
MKKGLVAALLVLPTVAMSMGAGVGVSADEADAPARPIVKQTNASVEIKGGTLQLKAVPNLSFNKVTVEDILTSRQGYVDSRLSDKSQKTIVLSDFRGDSNGWELSAKLSELTSRNRGKTNKLNKVQMMLALRRDGNSSMPLQAGAHTWLDAGGASQTLLNTDHRHPGAGVGRYTLNPADLRIERQHDVQAGTYTGTVTWMLASTR